MTSVAMYGRRRIHRLAKGGTFHNCNSHACPFPLRSVTFIFQSCQALGLNVQFQKMRRRLTVTGASETIDGVSKMTVSEPEVTPEGTKVRKVS